MNQAMPKNLKDSDISKRYNRAKNLVQGVFNPQKFVKNASVMPHWIGDSDCLWYEQETTAGKCYRLVDARNQTNSTGKKRVRHF